MVTAMTPWKKKKRRKGAKRRKFDRSATVICFFSAPAALCSRRIYTTAFSSKGAQLVVMPSKKTKKRMIGPHIS